MRAARSGFSLLEVILAMALLAGAVVVLGEVSRVALRNAEQARDLSRAQLLCESKMAEILSGITQPSAVDKSPFDPNLEPSVADDPWVFSIETPDSDEPGLIAVRVTVTKDLPEARHPASFSLVRWLPDPNAQQSSSSSNSNNSSNSSGSGSGSSPGSSAGGSNGT